MIHQLDSAALENAYSAESEISGGTTGTTTSSTSSVSTGVNSSSTTSSFSFVESIKESSAQFGNEIRKRLPGYDLKKQTGQLSSTMTFATLTESMSMSSEEMAGVVSKTFSILKKDSSSESEEEDDDDEEDDDSRSEEDDDDITSILSQKRLNRQMALLSPGERAESLLEHLESIEEIDDESVSSDCENESRDVSLIDAADSGEEGGNSVSDWDEGGSISDESEFDGFQEEALAALNGALYRLGNCNFADLDDDDGENDFLLSNIELPAFLRNRNRHKSSETTNGRSARQKKTALDREVNSSQERKGILDTLLHQCGAI